MESTKLTKVKISTLRGQEGAESAPAATPSGFLGSLAFLPSSFLGARLRPSARLSATLRLRAVGLSVRHRLSVRSVGSFPRSPSARAFCPFLPPQPPHIHAGCLSLGGSARCRSPRGGVRSLRSVSPRGVCAFGALASAWAVASRASLCPVRAASVASLALLFATLRLGGLRAPSVFSFFLPCGLFVVRRSLGGRQQ